MGKIIVVILATCAALGICAYFLGAHRLAGTAFNVPATEHTGAFGVSWFLVLGACVGFGIYKVVKGK